MSGRLLFGQPVPVRHLSGGTGVYRGCDSGIPLLDLLPLEGVTKVYRDLHHCLQNASIHGKSGWSLGVCRGPCGTRLPSPVVGGIDSLVWSVGRYALH